MRYLIDTHILLWWLNNDKRLSSQVSGILSDANNEIYVSIVSPWEIGVKVRINKLPLQTTLEEVFENIEFAMLPISLEHVVTFSKLPLHHKDPFDRMLIAQAQVENLTFITSDPKIKQYDIPVLS